MSTAAAAYPLTMLIGVCKLREDAASSKLRGAEYRLEEAVENEKKLQQALVEYRQWRLEEEDRRYRGIVGLDMNRAEMEDFRADLGLLKVREAEYEKEIIEAGRLITVREKEVEEARKAYMATLQETRKIETHRELWLEDWKKEQNRLEDIEMEEFTKAPDPTEDENADVEESQYD